MEIVDTVYLIAYLNPEDPLHSRSISIVEEVGGWRRVSQAALIELDLIMKSRGFTAEERRDTWTILTAILDGAVEPLLPEDFALAASLAERRGMDYFDSLIAAQCINRSAEVLTTDREIVEAVQEGLRGRIEP